MVLDLRRRFWLPARSRLQRSLLEDCSPATWVLLQRRHRTPSFGAQHPDQRRWRHEPPSLVPTLEGPRRRALRRSQPFRRPLLRLGRDLAQQQSYFDGHAVSERLQYRGQRQLRDGRMVGNSGQMLDGERQSLAGEVVA